MQVLTLPQARIPLGWVMVNGQRLPIEIDIEWMRALLTLVNRTGGVMGSEDFGMDVFGAVTGGISADEVRALETVFQAPQIDQSFPDIMQPTSGNQADVVTIKAGSASVPGLSVDGDPNTGIYSPSADVLAVTTGGTERIRFDTTKTDISGHLRVEGVTSTGATGTGNLVFATSPALTTPNLGTPSVLVGTNITGTAAALSVGYATSAGSAPTVGVTGTKTPPASLTVTNGLVTAWT